LANRRVNASPFYDVYINAPMHEPLEGGGSNALQTLRFPQTIYSSGWWRATLAAMAQGMPAFRRIDAAALRDTRNDSADIHAAALAQPEFARECLQSLG
jgi:spermidine synthase